MRLGVTDRFHDLPCYIRNFVEQICTSADSVVSQFYRLLKSRVGVVVVKRLLCKNRPSSVNVILKPTSLILQGSFQKSNCGTNYHPDTPSYCNMGITSCMEYQ